MPLRIPDPREEILEVLEKEPQLSQGEPKNGVKIRLFKQISIMPWM